jgi:hypothetical protein
VQGESHAFGRLLTADRVRLADDVLVERPARRLGQCSDSGDPSRELVHVHLLKEKPID